jgi:hypothetical protein
MLIVIKTRNRRRPQVFDRIRKRSATSGWSPERGVRLEDDEGYNVRNRRRSQAFDRIWKRSATVERGPEREVRREIPEYPILTQETPVMKFLLRSPGNKKGK